MSCSLANSETPEIVQGISVLKHSIPLWVDSVISVSCLESFLMARWEWWNRPPLPRFPRFLGWLPCCILCSCRNFSRASFNILSQTGVGRRCNGSLSLFFLIGKQLWVLINLPQDGHLFFFCVKYAVVNDVIDSSIDFFEVSCLSVQVVTNRQMQLDLVFNVQKSNFVRFVTEFNEKRAWSPDKSECVFRRGITRSCIMMWSVIAICASGGSSFFSLWTVRTCFEKSAALVPLHFRAKPMMSSDDLDTF